MRLFYPENLWALLILPAILIFVLLIRARRNKIIGALGKPSTISRLIHSVDSMPKVLSLVLFLTGLAFVIGSMARPQYPGGMEKIEARGGRIIVALDVSASMLAQDFQPDRLAKAKREITNLLDMLKAQTTGLIVFSGEAFILCPPTVDYSAFKMFLDIAEVGLISDTGTNIADAIEKATKLLLDDSNVDKAIVVFTDGESFEGDAIKASSDAAKNNIKIFTVGIGSQTGRPIPDLNSGALKKSDEGEIVISRLNSEQLTGIAENGNGKYFAATPGEREIEDLYSEIKGLRGDEREKKFRTLYDEKYRWFLIPGLLSIMASMFIPSRGLKDAAH